MAREFTDVLADRHQPGVKVHAIRDAQGTQKMGRPNLKRLRNAGGKVAKYHSVFWPDPRRYNNRTHRKLLIIDGKIGFVGGVGIADLWAGNADSPQHWRDNHYKAIAPVMAQLQATFATSWLNTRCQALHG